MKQINLFTSLILAAFICIGGYANAQIHPLAFGVGTINTNPNWYANYVGLRLEVVAPAAIAGEKVYKTANSGLGATGDWGGVVTVPIVNTPIFMDTTADSFGCSAFSGAAAATMNGKIAVIWRGPLTGSGPCDFGCKAQNAQNAGAVAIVLINEYDGQGPVGMAASTTCTGITIPVFMIGNLDGIAISGQYRSGVPVTMTITPWGQNLRNDLGFVPGGAAMWHSYAIPADQLAVTGNPAAYNMLDGAFIANYGTSQATGVKLKSSLSFTPTSGVEIPLHTSEVDLGGTPFTVDDSIYAMFNTTEYALNQAGTGRYDLTYLIESDTTDQSPADNSQTVSFYATDSVFSKGEYNFTTKQPSRTIYESFGGGAEFLWGPMYYVANSTTVAGVQYSLAMNSTTTGYPFLPTSNNIYIFKWNDGAISADSIVQDGELELVGSAVKTYDGFSDTSTALLYQKMYADTNGANTGLAPVLQANSWYFVCIDVPAATFLGCDGNLSPYPRVYGRYHANVGGSGNHLLDYSGLEMLYSTGGFVKDSLYFYPNQGSAPVPSGMTGYLNSVDSFVYSNMIGLIPAVAMTTGSTSAVKTVGKPLANVSLYPNPSKDQLNVSVSFDKNEKEVSYEIIDGLARFVGKETHTNVKDEVYSINTAKLAAGNYYLIINVEGRMITRKFVVVK